MQFLGFVCINAIIKCPEIPSCLCVHQYKSSLNTIGVSTKPSPVNQSTTYSHRCSTCSLRLASGSRFYQLPVESYAKAYRKLYRISSVTLDRQSAFSSLCPCISVIISSPPSKSGFPSFRFYLTYLPTHFVFSFFCGLCFLMCQFANNVCPNH